jgi:glutamate carboxypeptidase
MDEAPLALLERWCAIPSGSGDPEGLAEMHAAVAARLAALGAQVEDVPLAGGSPALSARMRPGAPVQVLLSGHIDTVHDRDAALRGCTRVGDRLVGAGVADMKGGLVVMLTALAALEASPEAADLGWRVLVTPDEEIGSPHSGPLLRDAAREAHAGLVVEPAADGMLVRSRKGVGVFRLRVTGRAAHAGRNPQEGRNAVVALADLVTRVAALHDPARGVLANVAAVRGGGPANVVPDAAAAVVDLRAARPAQAAELPERLRALAAQVARDHAVRVDVEGRFHRPPMPPSPGGDALLAAAVACGEGMGLRLAGADVGGGSDAALLADAGLPVLDGLGVRGGGLHGPDEYCEVDSVAERSALLTCLLRRLARGEVPLPGAGR